jgi:predicted ATP-dependent protease
VTQKAKSVPPEALRRTCDPSSLGFETTSDLETLEGVIEQERAVRSLKVGLSIDKRNYNIYVAGASGTGRTTIVRSIVEATAARRPVPQDWVYVYNFKEKENPTAFRLPAGLGRKLAADMDALVTSLKVELPKAFRERTHQEDVQEVVSRSLAREHEFFADLSHKAVGLGFAVKSTKTGLITIPLKNEQTLSNKEYEALNDEEKKEIEERRRELEPHIHDFVSKTRNVEARTQEEIKKKQSLLARKISSIPVGKLRRRYGRFDGLKTYFDAVQKSVLDNLGKFVREEAPQGHQDPEAERREFVEYKVNVLVDNGDLEGAPVVIEPRPTYYNLFGKIEKKVENGVYFTDFTMIKAGTVLKANGGYLLINTNDLFAYPLVWENLKSILRYRQAPIEDIGEHLGFLPTSGLKPAPIPINLKIILVGPPYVYEVLHRYDEDFRKLFQVKSEFDYEMPRNEQTVNEYARFIATTCENEKLRSVDKEGVAAIIEFGSRLVESQRKVTLQFNQICNILIEADELASDDKAELIGRRHVDQAVAQREFRLSLLEEKVRAEVIENSILIETTGSRLGAVNALAVYEVGDYLFGKPSRITAAVYAGKGGVINVERESRLSGNIHSKGVLIISGYLGSLFAQKTSPSLTVSLCFEQSYGYIDGDSASSSELFSILSALSETPLRQGLAVTGSVNQQGDIQPVGGINEKIEAWYFLCKARGLTGDQGVVIPKANLDNLMLKMEVVEAVRGGKFFVYPITTVAEGIEILTGIPAGTRNQDFEFEPEDSIFARAARTLTRYEPEEKEEDEDEDEDEEMGSGDPDSK